MNAEFYELAGLAPRERLAGTRGTRYSGTGSVCVSLAEASQPEPLSKTAIESGP